MTEGSDPGHAARGRAVERLSRLAIFDPEDYLATNPDVARTGLSPTVHAAHHGLREDRAALSDLAMARAYGAAAKGEPAEHRPPPSASGRGRATVFVHSLSDDAYRQLAASLAADLEAVGFEATRSDERADHRGDHGTAVFVAPHEFFELGRGPLWRDPQILGAGFVVIDDPIGSHVLRRSLVAVLDARGVIDTSALGAQVWAEAGIPAFRLTPHATLRSRWLAPTDLGHPLLLAVPRDAAALDLEPLRTDARPFDLLFFDPHSPRRSAALGRLSAALARHRCFVYCQQPVAGKAAERLHRAAHWRISGHLSAHSRLTLNLTADALPCLDRRRVVAQAMAGGSVVVSDARFVEPGLEAGAHYFADDTRHLGALIDWLLLDPEGRAAADRTRDRAFDRLAAGNTAARRLGGLRDFLLAAPGDGISDP